MSNPTMKQWLKTINDDDIVDKSFMTPIRDLMLEIKLVNKDKNRQVPTPYVALTIIVPTNVATTIPELMNSKWRLALLGVMMKDKKGGNKNVHGKNK